MEKSTFSVHYEALTGTLRELRRKQRVSQRELAVRLRREQTMVARVERGERRLDLVEFYWYCNALKADPLKAAVKFLKECRKRDRPQERKKRTKTRNMKRRKRTVPRVGAV